nr:MAG TPA: zipper dimerization domain transcription factor-like protein [Caudoviricetes sp.]
MIGDTRPLLKTISQQKQANLELCDEIKALKEKIRYLESIGQYRTPKFTP